MKKLVVKIADCSGERLIRTARHCGFGIVEGRKHCKIKTIKGDFVTTIPRHKRLKRELIRSVVTRFNEFGGNVELR